jgi:hypothetical protein
VFLAQAVSNVSSAYDDGSNSNAMSSMAGEDAEDLHLFDMGNVTLKKGERLYRTFVDETTSIAHRYDIDLEDQVNSKNQFVRNDKEGPTPVWHVLLLKNDTSAPWTTAPILIENASAPIAQSMMHYTPRGAQTMVKLTQALNIVAESLEFRSGAPDGEPIIERHQYRNFERVTVEGKLSLSNRTGKSVPVRIRKNLSGRVLSTEPEAEVISGVERIGKVNASRILQWSFELPANETWKGTYKYEVLISR